MLIPFRALAVSAALLSSQTVLAVSPSDIPADTPVSQLVKTANAQLAAGKLQDALTYFDVAITRDPQNYLTIFKRGAAYLSLGRSSQAQRDFDKVLELKPGFEGALIQRAKIKARDGHWSAAKLDYEAAGKTEGQEIAELEEAQGAAKLAAEAEKSGNWDECIHQAGVAIMTAGAVLELRNIRSRCRFEKGEVAEGVSDLQHVLQLNSGSTEPHLRISAMTFYSLGETEKGLTQIRRCLQSDPDSKSCRVLMKKEKEMNKSLKKLNQLVEKRQFASAVKLLIKSGEDEGLIQDAKTDFDQLVSEGLIHGKAPNGLYSQLLELTCESYIEMNSYRRAHSYCANILKIIPTSEWGLLSKAKSQLEAEEFDAAINTLNEAKEHHETQRVQNMLQEAQTLLRRSKQKDYYKILGVSRDADERDIKRAYRKLVIKFHPDKAAAQGISSDDAQKKMADINEAYETLSDPELKARVDRGEDPNDPSQQGSPFQGSPFGGQQFAFRQGGGFPGGSFQFQGGFPGGFGF